MDNIDTFIEVSYLYKYCSKSDCLNSLLEINGLISSLLY